MKGFVKKGILLVHPLGYEAHKASKDISRKANIMPPLGLASLAAYLDQQKIENSIVDCYAHPDAARTIKDELLRLRPAFIGLSCTTSSFLDGVRVIQKAKEVLPGIKAVVGGPHVSALKEKVLEGFPEVDFVVVGEGEATITELILANGEGAEQIKGLVFRDRSGEVCFNGYRMQIADLDTLPFPAYEKLHGFPQVYSLPIFNYPTTPNTSCISSRGCPYACSYCDRSVFQKSFRFNSADYLVEHVKYLKNNFGVRHINFYDDQFTFNRQRVIDFTEKLLSARLQVTFNCAVRANHVDEDLLVQMKAAGCWMISLGIETGDADLLAQHRQQVDLQMLAEKIRLMKKIGLRVKGLLMMGLPGESEESIQKSMEYFFSLPIDDLNLSKFTPFPGTPLFENIQQCGEFNEDWQKMDCMHFEFVPVGMNREQMERLFTEFYKRHYTQPRILFNYFTMLWRSPDSWWRFVCNLKHFIQFARSSQRISSST